MKYKAKVHEINLINIHRGNLEILENQASMFDAAHLPVHVTNQIKSTKGSIDELLDTLRKKSLNLGRRFQALSEKRAIYGISADPSVKMEMEDIEEELKAIEAFLLAEDGGEEKPEYI